LTDVGLASSRSEATRLIRGGGISVNDEAVQDEKRRLTREDLWKNALIVLSKGKRSKHVLKLERAEA
jgi:tyrosyl-tRNA synthetase